MSVVFKLTSGSLGLAVVCVLVVICTGIGVVRCFDPVELKYIYITEKNYSLVNYSFPLFSELENENNISVQINTYII